MVRFFNPKLVISTTICLAIVYFSKGEWSRIRYKQDKKTSESSIYERRGTTVILLSNQRSGSSFVGEFFNRALNGFYLFEPLLPFTPNCTLLNRERLQLLSDMSHCDFSHLVDSYKKAKHFHVSSRPECIKNGMCSPRNHAPLLKRYSKICNTLRNKDPLIDLTKLQTEGNEPSVNEDEYEFDANGPCGFPLNMTLLSSICYSSKLVSYKILRVCALADLEDIAQQLASTGTQLYVIELVRDPRAIINSALNLELKRSDLDRRLDTLCGRWRGNMNHERTVLEGKADKNGDLVLNACYLRVRYEDIAMDPVHGAENIYNHVGMTLPEEIKEWIEDTAVDPAMKISQLKQSILRDNLSESDKEDIGRKIKKLIRGMKSPYGTVRDPREVLIKWRKNLPMDVVHRIQAKCGDVMKRMGYKLISTEEERNNLDDQLW